MVGEIRDSETAKLATEAALTGHLVLTTLHTSDAPTAVPRLANMGVEPYLIAASLRGALAQRLVRKICPKCRTPGTISAAEHEALSIAAGEDVHDLNPFIGAGCEFCRNAGYVGRTGVFELLTFDEESLASIAHDPSIRNVRHVARHTGLITLAQDGIAKVSQGIISVPSLLEIVSYTPETESNHHYSSPMKQKIAA
jgi:type II secretory ATPase GspE/PulE/Tfp pilus assembly ATPase PilB-like protein